MRPSLAAAAFLLACSASLPAQYPRILKLDQSDPVFSQLQEGLEDAYREEALSRSGGRADASPGPSALALYSYVLPADIDVFSLAARLNLPYDSLAGINRIDGATVLKAGASILIPSRPGIFLRDAALSELDILMASWRDPETPGMLKLKLRDQAAPGSKPATFWFFPGERFHPAERAYFLNALYRYPLPKSRLTSGFGRRPSPFTGSDSMHTGIDLAAPQGTPVLAAREGRVSALGFDAVLGNRVVLDHGGGWVSVYGHLSSFSVSLNEEVESGTILGAVGSTGLSTGPHLHFEIRSGGEARNPETYLPRLRK